jgi:hypothetical protein
MDHLHSTFAKLRDQQIGRIKFYESIGVMQTGRRVMMVDQLLSGVIRGYEKGETIDEAVVELGQIMKTKHQWASKFIYGDTHKLI